MVAVIKLHFSDRAVTCHGLWSNVNLLLSGLWIQSFCLYSAPPTNCFISVSTYVSVTYFHSCGSRAWNCRLEWSESNYIIVIFTVRASSEQNSYSKLACRISAGEGLPCGFVLYMLTAAICFACCLLVTPSWMNAVASFIFNLSNELRYVFIQIWICFFMCGYGLQKFCVYLSPPYFSLFLFRITFWNRESQPASMSRHRCVSAFFCVVLYFV
jgi:hypothetical protein